MTELERSQLVNYGSGPVPASRFRLERPYVHADTILLLFLDDFIIFELEIANKSKCDVLQ